MDKRRSLQNLISATKTEQTSTLSKRLVKKLTIQCWYLIFCYTTSIFHQIFSNSTLLTGGPFKQPKYQALKTFLVSHALGSYQTLGCHLTSSCCLSPYYSFISPKRTCRKPEISIVTSREYYDKKNTFRKNRRNMMCQSLRRSNQLPALHNQRNERMDTKGFRKVDMAIPFLVDMVTKDKVFPANSIGSTTTIVPLSISVKYGHSDRQSMLTEISETKNADSEASEVGKCDSSSNIHQKTAIRNKYRSGFSRTRTVVRSETA